MTELAKSFEPLEIEGQWYERWADAGTFKPSMATDQPAYCIQLPPPNVTGTLHMGHAFNQTIMDGLIRYHRMKGDNTLWLPGTDHAGIATQIVVERQLADQGVSRHDLGRAGFVEKVWEWKKHSGSTITGQMKRLGSSCDWSREYFTMDDNLSQTVTEVFVRLYEENLIYRGKRLVNWDPVLGTAVSDLEVVSEEEDGSLWHIRYPLVETDAVKGLTHLVVATTRPETMLGDVAVMVHPEDERYQHLIGKSVTLPLCNRQIPIIADDYVDKEFGTGVVKVTPAHDFNDYAVGQRHGLAQISILTLDAKINEESPEKYQGQDRFAARKAVVADLEAEGFLESVKPHKLMVPRGDRTGAVIEPMLTDQWFVAMSKADEKTGKSITQKAKDVVSSGEVKFYPEQWVNTYNQWLNNIQDWCISRQLWWGHQIPAWYGEAGEIFVAQTEAAAYEKAKAAGYKGTLKRDEDVLDTWFSAALFPFSTVGWPKETPEFNAFLPSSVLVTGFDIIFFWVARMIMMTTHFTGKVPFKDVYVHGLVRDAEGKKMSKSEGNTLDPVDLIDGIPLPELLKKRTTGLRRPEKAPQIATKTEKEFPEGIPAYGADALRFTFASLASLGRSINFDQKRCQGYRNFCNKLWNATRFVLMNTQDKDCGVNVQAIVELSFVDRWIISRLQELEAHVATHFDNYRFDLAAQALYEFVWSDYCDWYLELTKVQLQQGNEAVQRGTRRTLLRVLEVVLRLMHPIMPFITEELWQTVAPLAGRKLTEFIAQASWPLPDASRLDQKSVAAMEQFQALINACRTLRSDMQLSPAQKVPLIVKGDEALLKEWAPYLMPLAKISELNVVEELPVTQAPVQHLGTMSFMLHIELDPVKEQQRIEGELAKIEPELARLIGQLGNPQFVERAPAHLVEQSKARVIVLEEKRAAFLKQKEQSLSI
ncbi:MAG: valine--tRNA ligase [Pseudomonadota bacterium]